MKKITLALLLLAFLFQVNAQETTTYKYRNALKVSPFEFGQSKFQVSYELYNRSRSQSLLVMPSLILEENGKDIKKGVELMMQYRFFLSHLRKGENKTLGFYDIGFYAGPYMLIVGYREDYERDIYYPDKGNAEQMTFEKDVEAVEAGVILGIQFDITTRILLDFYIGGGIRQGDVMDSFDDFDHPDDFYYEPSYGVFDIEYTGVKPKVGFQVGISF